MPAEAMSVSPESFARSRSSLMRSMPMDRTRDRSSGLSLTIIVAP